MESIGRAAKPRIVNIPRLTDEELRRLAMPILAVVGGRDVLIDSAQIRQPSGAANSFLLWLRAQRSA
jgi:hypothetical protein